eukprot:GILI01027765.1.p1 GENE.GILI01027765.1~~GILI01027765.1.p1  ORF type:complete len:107 (-),score=19.31 GILI01027765.1:96-416(-)
MPRLKKVRGGDCRPNYSSKTFLMSIPKNLRATNEAIENANELPSDDMMKEGMYLIRNILALYIAVEGGIEEDEEEEVDEVEDEEEVEEEVEEVEEVEERSIVKGLR